MERTTRDRAALRTPALSEADRRFDVEAMLSRTRIAGAALYVAAASVQTGDSVVTTVLIGGLLVAGAAVGGWAVRDPERLGPRTGVLFMAFDTLIVSAVLANNLRDPVDVVSVIAVLPTLEAALRWGRTGGLAGGTVMAMVTAAWTVTVAAHTDMPVATEAILIRGGLMIVVGQSVGLLVRHLQQQHLVLQYALDASSDAMVSLDSQGRILSANEHCAEIFGRPPAELVGCDVTALLGVTDQDLGQQLAAGAGASTNEIRTTALTGARWVEVTTIPVAGLAISYAVVRDVTDRVAREVRLDHDANHDVLTGLPNRRRLMQHAAEVLAAPGTRHELALLFIDLDDFKEVNDSFGHSAGDQLLQKIADRLVTAIRPGDLAVRLGGDEFAVVLTSVPDRLMAGRTAQRILDLIERPVAVDEGFVSVRASLGVAHGVPHLTTIDELLHEADVAMYAAKTQGKASWAEYSDGMEEHFLGSRSLAGALRGSLARPDDISVHYQPICAIDGSLIGVEALARWSHAERGSVPPESFIPAAEASGQMIELGRRIRRTALDDVAPFVHRGEGVSLSINVSGQELRHPTFVGELVADAALARFPLERLVVEITESTVVEQTPVVAEGLTTLRKMGVRIAFDDFGTGYASFSALRWLPLDILKIDRSFVHGLTDAGPDRSLVEAVLLLGRRLDLTVIAEGVETDRQHRLLADAGCGAAQGYLFGRPVPAEQLAGMLGRPRRHEVDSIDLTRHG